MRTVKGLKYEVNEGYSFLSNVFKGQKVDEDDVKFERKGKQTQLSDFEQRSIFFLLFSPK